MKSNRTWPARVALLTIACGIFPLHAGDWKTNDGKVYQDVKLIRLDPDAVTILYTDGGARVPLANLPPDLQKRFGFDPVAAKAAADARAKEAAANAKALQAEMDQASEQRQPGPEPVPVADASDSGAAASHPLPASPVFASGTHHLMDDITSTMKSLKADSTDASHHSIDEMSQSATAMRRDLSDPTYHTMAHLVYTVHSLGPDPTDPNHHTMSEVTDGAQK
jgi:hypothetical protein